MGTPLGTVVFFAILRITSDEPAPLPRNFDEFMLTAGIHIAVIAGAAPAFVTGIAAGLLRIYIRPLLAFAGVTALVGAGVTALYIEFLTVFFFRLGLLKQGEVILTGGIAAFCCAFLLWRNRPWTIA